MKWIIRKYRYVHTNCPNSVQMPNVTSTACPIVAKINRSLLEVFLPPYMLSLTYFTRQVNAQAEPSLRERLDLSALILGLLQ
jgi:hypothetical protein